VIALFRLIAALGLAILGSSFAFAGSYHNSPYGRFRWAADEVIAGEGLGHVLVYLGVAAVIAYPHVWAIVATLTVARPWKPGARLPLWSHIACHGAGLSIIALFGALLLIRGDTYVPRGVQIAAVCVPAFLAAAVLAVARFEKPRRRIPAITLVGLLPHVAIQPALAYAVYRDGGPAWGYLLAAAGVAAGIGGCLCLYAIEGIRERSYLSGDPDL
jgi:hypothetical protein